MNKKILYVTSIIIVLLLGYLGYRFINHYKNNYINNNSVTDNKDSEYSEINLINYNERAYSLPNDVGYRIEKKDDKEILQLYSNTNKWKALIAFLDKSEYEADLFDNPSKLEEELKRKSSEIEFKNRKETELSIGMMISFEKNGIESNSLIAYMPVDDKYEYEIELFDGDNKTMNYTALDIVEDILGTALKSPEKRDDTDDILEG